MGKQLSRRRRMKIEQFGKAIIGIALLAILALTLAACGAAEEDTGATAVETETDAMDDTSMAEESMDDTSMAEESMDDTSMAEETMDDTGGTDLDDLAQSYSTDVPTEGQRVHMTTETPRRDGVVRVRGVDATCFDTDKTGCGWWGYSNHFDTLTHWYREEPLVVGDYRPLPELAESWEFISPTHIVFKLREGVMFHDTAPVDGREVVADDVKYSFERSLAPDSRQAPALGPVSEVNVLSDYEVEFKFDTPYAPFMTTVSQALGYPIRAPEVEDEFGDLNSFDAMIGTGQYMIDDYEVGVKQQFVRNEQYFRGPNGITGQELPYIQYFNVLIIPEEAAVMAMYRSGLMDHGPSWWCWGFWSALDDHLEALSDRSDLVFHYHSTGGGAYANYHYGPKIEGIWENQKLRWAVALYNDISCQAWCAVTGGIQPTRLVAADNPWFLAFDELNEDGAQFYTNFPDPTMDLDKAKQYVMEAKQELGLPLDKPVKTTFTIKGTDQSIIDVSNNYLADLGKIGIDAELVSLDRIEFNRVRKGDFTGLALWYNSGWLDADALFYNRFHSESVNNFIGLSDPHLDDLIIQGRSVLDPAERLPIYHEIQRYLADMQYDVAVPNWTNTNMFPEWVKNPGPQLSGSVGDLWLKAWIDLSHPTRSAHDWEEDLGQ